LYATAACERERKEDIWQKKSWALEMHALIDKMGLKKKISACFKPFFFVSVLNVLFQKKKKEGETRMDGAGEGERRKGRLGGKMRTKYNHSLKVGCSVFVLTDSLFSI